MNKSIPCDVKCLLRRSFSRVLLNIPSSKINWNSKRGTQKKACLGVRLGVPDRTLSFPSPSLNYGHGVRKFLNIQKNFHHIMSRSNSSRPAIADGAVRPSMYQVGCFFVGVIRSHAGTSISNQTLSQIECPWHDAFTVRDWGYLFPFQCY